MKIRRLKLATALGLVLLTLGFCLVKTFQEQLLISKTENATKFQSLPVDKVTKQDISIDAMAPEATAGGPSFPNPADNYLLKKPTDEMTQEEIDKVISLLFPGGSESDPSIRSYREAVEESRLMKNYLDHYPPLEKQAIMTGIEPPGFDAGLKWVAKPPPGLAEEFHQRLASGESLNRRGIKKYFSSFRYPVPFPLEKPWTDIKIRELLDGDFPAFFYVENGKSYLKWMGNPYLDRNQLWHFYYRDGDFVHLFTGPAGQDLSEPFIKTDSRILTLDTENDLYYEWNISNETFDLNRKIFEENWTEE